MTRVTVTQARENFLSNETPRGDMMSQCETIEVASQALLSHCSQPTWHKVIESAPRRYLKRERLRGHDPNFHGGNFSSAHPAASSSSPEGDDISSSGFCPMVSRPR